MKAHNTSLAMALAAVLAALPAHAGLTDWLNKQIESVQEGALPGSATGGMAALTEREMVDGLKQALEVGVERASRVLGREGGFLANPQVRIPLPESLQSVDNVLRTLGQGQVADDFVASMNHAAERAVPAGVDVFGQAIRNMTLEDARGILDGPDDAATRYFREQTTQPLTQAFRPIVSDATSQVGVTSNYKRLMGKAGFLSSVVEPQNLDLDQYVTSKALDGLFLTLAEEERRIRENPTARTTELLKKVFSR